MVEPGQETLFEPKPLDMLGSRQPSVADQLQSDFLVEIIAVGQIHRAHAALSYFVSEGVGSNGLP